MRIARLILTSFDGGLSRPPQNLHTFRFLSTTLFSGFGLDRQQPNNNSFESADDIEQRIFNGSAGDSSKAQAFYKKFDKIGWGLGSSNSTVDGQHEQLDSLDESFTTLSDGMSGKLKKAATDFEFDDEEVDKDDYAFRPDSKVSWGDTYELKDLDLRRPPIISSPEVPRFDTTTEEVLQKADFRNVRFLANFLTDAGLIIKRSSTGISAKAQRKVAREIKTARSFGLMPFTTMGKRKFIYGKTMEEGDEDYIYETLDNDSVPDEEYETLDEIPVAERDLHS